MPNTEPNKPIATLHVAVGIVRDHAGCVLIAERRTGQHLAGYWEFPGGKVEAGESVFCALARELKEEVGIGVLGASPMLRIGHQYPEKKVLLDVWKITSFSNEPAGLEGQSVAWVAPEALGAFRFPEANAAIVNALRLPDSAGITGHYQTEAEFFERLKRALKRGRRLVYLRNLPSHAAETMAHKALALCRDASSVPVVSDIALARAIPGLGLHLKSDQLKAATLDSLQGLALVGASAHNKSELLQCKSLKLHYAFLSPVFETSSHSGVQGMGPSVFADLVNLAGIPIYALGGMSDDDAAWVRASGGQGVATLSEFWATP